MFELQVENVDVFTEQFFNNKVKNFSSVIPWIDSLINRIDVCMIDFMII